jgi:heptaprenyl diphosphate synthase
LSLPGFDSHARRVEAALQAAVRSDNPAMNEMAGHLIAAGGKNVRPMLGVGAAATGGTVSDEVILGGVAVELVQVGSLCHDDVIDEAETRRGVESVNTRWGNLRAILTGDFLLARASEIAASLGTEVAGLLAATIGRLCEGEVTELQHAYDVDRTEASYLTAIDGKTASLFATACRIGAIVAELPRPHIDALTDYGREFGLAFQVVDDVLDVVATDEELGKPAGHDIAEGVYNLPVILALASSSDDRLRGLLGGPVTGEVLDEALSIVRGNGAVAASIEVASRHVEAAVAALEPLPPSPAAIALADTARALLEGLPIRA